MKNIIFDLDGTLLNTLEDIADACNVILQKYACPAHPVASYRHMVGNGFDKLIRRALPAGHTFNEEKIAEITADAKNYYASHLFLKTAPYPGITEMLCSLADMHKSLAVLSNKPDPMTREIISHFFPNIPFALVQGAKADLPLKPSPLPLLHIMEEFSWKPAESCYVGDSDVDIITGKNARINTAAVCWGFRDKSELEKENPDFLCANPQELLKALA